MSSLNHLSGVLAVALAGSALSAPVKAQKGDSAPEFSGAAIDGRKVNLAAFRGKNPVLLSFFAEFTPGSRKDFTHLKELDDSWSAKGLRILAVAQDETKEAPTRLVSAVRARFPVILDRDAAIAGKYGVQALPHHIVIDRAGKIQAVVVGSDAAALDRAVEQAVK
jgi:peroxiredoxin